MWWSDGMVGSSESIIRPSKSLIGWSDGMVGSSESIIGPSGGLLGPLRAYNTPWRDGRLL